MLAVNTISNKFYRTRSKYWRNNRVLFPSPAELQFIRVMGGRVAVIKLLKHPKTGFPLAYVKSLGRLLNSEKFKREVRVGKYWVDFGNDIKWGIEVDGLRYHNDPAYQKIRDAYFVERGWRVLHIPATMLWSEPGRVQQNVLTFLVN